MSVRLFPLSYLVLALLLWGFFLSCTQDPKKEGQQLYSAYCSNCHGFKGDGKGELAYLLYPKPRDFSIGSFKLRSTSSGNLPTLKDLVKTITKGMPGTAMPSFNFLKSEQTKKTSTLKIIGNLHLGARQKCTLTGFLMEATQRRGTIQKTS